MRTKVSAAMVKELRERTGAGMMDCKKALMDDTVDGNIDKAIDWLRTKGIAKAAKNADRESSEGVIATFFNSSSSSLNNHKITVLEVNSETDFVGRNEDFQQFVLNVAKSTNQMNTGELNVDEILSLNTTPNGNKINDLLIDAINLIRENIKIKRAYNFDINDVSSYACYVHGKVYSNQDDNGDNIQMGKSACVIALLNDTTTTTTTSNNNNNNNNNETAYKLAMHATACKPNFISIDDIPNDIIEKERLVCEAQTNEEEI